MALVVVMNRLLCSDTSRVIEISFWVVILYIALTYHETNLVREYFRVVLYLPPSESKLKSSLGASLVVVSYWLHI